MFTDSSTIHRHPSLLEGVCTHEDRNQPDTQLSVLLQSPQVTQYRYQKAEPLVPYVFSRVLYDQE